jgi:hypothetical protein
MNTFTGGDGFYGYRYGLEFLACSTPALALSRQEMGRLERVLLGPLVALQAFAFLLGAFYDNLHLSQTVAWRQNAFVHTLDHIGPAGWVVAILVAVAGLLVSHRLARPPDQLAETGQASPTKAAAPRRRSGGVSAGS